MKKVKEKKVKARKPFYKKAWFWIIAIIIVIGATGGNDDSDSSTTNSNTETKVSQTQTIENKDDAPKDDVPAEYLNALNPTVNYQIKDIKNLPFKLISCNKLSKVLLMFIIKFSDSKYIFS